MNNKQQLGFTMVELLIVVAIMGIVGSTAMYYYGKNVLASNRTDGQSGLQITATRLEKCKSLYGSYNSANCPVSSGDVVLSPEELYYILVVTEAATFKLEAYQSLVIPAPIDEDCKTIVLDNLGKKTGTGPDITKCW